MKLNKSLLQILPLAIIFLGLLSYNYINATGSWTPPCGTPTNCNTDAPLNDGTTLQDKNGILSMNAAVLSSTWPRVHFNDETTGSISSEIRNDFNNLYFMSDRDNSGTIDAAERPDPMVLHMGQYPDQDFAVINNEIHSDSYCDQAGKNCFTPSQVQTGAFTCPTGQALNRINANGTVYCITVPNAVAPVTYRWDVINWVCSGTYHVKSGTLVCYSNADGSLVANSQCSGVTPVPSTTMFDPGGQCSR